jgi:cytochrome c biogenesis protein CcdA
MRRRLACPASSAAGCAAARLTGAFSLGVFFALGWAPCAVSLVFSVLIWLISQDVTPLVGGMMLFVFGLGHGVPVIPIATFSRAVGWQIGEKYISAGKYVTKIFGIVVILIGVFMPRDTLGSRCGRAKSGRLRGTLNIRSSFDTFF